MKTIKSILIILIFISANQYCQKIKGNISEIFEGYKAAFVLYDYNDNIFIKHNSERCKQRFSPASTFKIPNSLIGLETGVINDAEFPIPWDSVKTWNENWNRDHTLRSAIKYSVVPYYKELARRVGREKMQTYLENLNYGNINIGNKVDEFWLNGDLQISANEQVDFLVKLYKNEVPFSQRSIDIVKDIIIVEKNDNYTIRAKTGGGILSRDKMIGWYVGYVETQKGVYFFALNIEGSDFPKTVTLRTDLTMKALRHLGIINSNE